MSVEEACDGFLGAVFRWKLGGSCDSAGWLEVEVVFEDSIFAFNFPNHSFGGFQLRTRGAIASIEPVVMKTGGSTVPQKTTSMYAARFEAIYHSLAKWIIMMI